MGGAATWIPTPMFFLLRHANQFANRKIDFAKRPLKALYITTSYTSDHPIS